MDEEISIIDTKTRNEKIKSFFVENKKLILSSLVILFIIIISFYSFKIFKEKHKEKLSEKFNTAIIEYKNGNKLNTISSMKEVIKNKDNTYSVLALYFLIDNNLIDNRKEINDLFDILINKSTLEQEIRNLIIYKKALYNADYVNENDLLNILNPVLNSESVWNSHALYLIAEYFYSKNEKQKSKEFFQKIISTKNANTDIVQQAQKRLSRDLSE